MRSMNDFFEQSYPIDKHSPLVYFIGDFGVYRSEIEGVSYFLIIDPYQGYLDLQGKLWTFTDLDILWQNESLREEYTYQKWREVSPQLWFDNFDEAGNTILLHNWLS